MDKWRQGLKIDLWATKLWPALFNLKQEFYPAQPSSSRNGKFAKSASSTKFSQPFCFIPGEQMSTLWANGDMGLKSTFGQQNSSQHSLTSNKNFTSSTILFKNKFAKSAFFHKFASFQVNKCPLYGQMETGA